MEEAGNPALKDTIAGKSINKMLDKVYLPAEITLRSEGDEPHTLTGKGNYLFMTGRPGCYHRKYKRGRKHKLSW